LKHTAYRLSKTKLEAESAAGRARFVRQHGAFFIRLVLFVLALQLLCFDALGFDQTVEPARTTSRPADLWLFLPLGYLLTIAIEAPVLILGLSKRFSFRECFFAGVWLTACTYPVVVLVLPTLFASSSRSLYLVVAETFAPLAECALFWLVFREKLGSGPGAKLRSFAVITLANLLSFAAGELLNAVRWFGLF
jgi:hypothetical protein